MMAMKSKAKTAAMAKATAAELAELHSAIEAELDARKLARRALPDYRPSFVIVSPYEDQRLVLADHRRRHPDVDPLDFQIIVWAIQSPRPEFVTPASQAAGEVREAEMIRQAEERREHVERSEQPPLARECPVAAAPIAATPEPEAAPPDCEQEIALPVEEEPRRELPRRYDGPAWQRSPYWWMTR
jgi:hypothetical protein